MSMQEMQSRFTKSEIAVMAWRSAETVYNMSSGRPQTHHANGNVSELPFQGRDRALPDREFEALEDALGESIVTAMVDEEGEIDLRRLSGDQALKYLQTLGLPIAPGLSRNTSGTDPYGTVENYRQDAARRK